MKILGIESSCDETAASVIDGDIVLSDVIASQIAIHQPYGGVVPELASRHHIMKIVPVVEAAMKEAGMALSSLDAIAATSGPGLVGSIVVGLQTAKSVAWALNIPFVGVNHLRGHLLAARIQDGDNPIPEFPYMALLASGGHTGIYIVQGHNQMQCLGQTRDDAAGEAYDKVAKLLRLGYPGGPIIDTMAHTPGESIPFPQALRKRSSYEFSFSGIKTAVAQHVANLRKQNPTGPTEEEMRAIARGFQTAVVEILVRKVVLAAREKQIPSIVLAGGVAANSGLREHAAAVCAEYDIQLFAPNKARCTDNASMIAYAGSLSIADGERSDFNLAPRANWPL